MSVKWLHYHSDVMRQTAGTRDQMLHLNDQQEEWRKVLGAAQSKEEVSENSVGGLLDLIC